KSGKSRVTGTTAGAFTVGTATCAATACSADVTVTGALAGLRAVVAKKVAPKTLGHATIAVRGTKPVALSIKLSKKALAALKKAHSVKVTVTVTLSATGSAPVTKKYTMTLVAPKAKKKKRK